MSTAPAPRSTTTAEPDAEKDETRAGEKDETGGEGLPAVIYLPDQSQPEPAPPPPRRGPRRSGNWKGRHFGPRPVDDPRTAWLTTRCTPAFRASVLAAAEQAGMSLADYVHSRLGGEPSRRARRQHGPDVVAKAQILAALGRSGNNLNQLLRHVNSYDFRGNPELLEMCKAMTAAHAAHHALVAAIKADLGV
jgi:hypothetical protein